MNMALTIIPYHANILQMLLWKQWKTLKIPWNFLLINGCGWTYMIWTYVTLCKLIPTHGNPPRETQHAVKSCIGPSIPKCWPKNFDFGAGQKITVRRHHWPLRQVTSFDMFWHTSVSWVNAKPPGHWMVNSWWHLESVHASVWLSVAFACLRVICWLVELSRYILQLSMFLLFLPQRSQERCSHPQVARCRLDWWSACFNSWVHGSKLMVPLNVHLWPWDVWLWHGLNLRPPWNLMIEPRAIKL